MQLLRFILDLLFPTTSFQALVEDATIESLGVHVRPTVIEKDLVALFPYRQPLVRACVVEAKFKDNEKAQHLLASVLVDYLNEWSASYSPFAAGPLVLVPVPLSSTRFKERGYNQSERIARLAAKRLPEVYLDTDILIRVRNTLPQTSLGRIKRRTNVGGAFALSGPLDPSYTYIVLDDVLTTGATLTAALSAFTRENGQVLGIALAH